MPAPNSDPHGGIEDFIEADKLNQCIPIPNSNKVKYWKCFYLELIKHLIIKSPFSLTSPKDPRILKLYRGFFLFISLSVFKFIWQFNLINYLYTLLNLVGE